MYRRHLGNSSWAKARTHKSIHLLWQSRYAASLAHQHASRCRCAHTPSTNKRNSCQICGWQPRKCKGTNSAASMRAMQMQLGAPAAQGQPHPCKQALSDIACRHSKHCVGPRAATYMERPPSISSGREPAQPNQSMAVAVTRVRAVHPPGLHGRSRPQASAQESTSHQPACSTGTSHQPRATPFLSVGVAECPAMMLRSRMWHGIAWHLAVHDSAPWCCLHQAEQPYVHDKAARKRSCPAAIPFWSHMTFHSLNSNSGKSLPWAHPPVLEHDLFYRACSMRARTSTSARSSSDPRNPALLVSPLFSRRATASMRSALLALRNRTPSTHSIVSTCARAANWGRIIVCSNQTARSLFWGRVHQQQQRAQHRPNHALEGYTTLKRRAQARTHVDEVLASARRQRGSIHGGWHSPKSYGYLARVKPQSAH